MILAGIGTFLYPKISNYLAEKNQTEIIREYKENIKIANEEDIDIEYEKARKYNEKINETSLNFDNNSNYEEILNPLKNGIMAYIEIPKISIYLPIYHGTEDKIMKKGVGHLKNTSLPIGGKSTHCVLTGHTGLLKAEIFTRLNELEVADYFYIYTLNERLIYKIYQIKIVLPTQLEDLQIIEGKDLTTLITCTPYGINTHRLLVQGERIETIENLTEENNSEKINLEKKEEKKGNYYLIGSLFGLIVLLIIISCCILLNYIVKYIKKVRKR